MIQQCLKWLVMLNFLCTCSCYRQI